MRRYNEALTMKKPEVDIISLVRFRFYGKKDLTDI